MKKNYYGIDIGKFVASIMVIYMHTIPFIDSYPFMNDLLFSISRMAVPFFFCASGFLFFNRVEKTDESNEYLKKYIFRIASLYVIWSILMLPFSLIGLRQHGFIKGIVLYVRNFFLVGSFFNFGIFLH